MIGTIDLTMREKSKVSTIIEETDSNEKIQKKAKQMKEKTERKKPQLVECTQRSLGWCPSVNIMACPAGHVVKHVTLLAVEQGVSGCRFAMCRTPIGQSLG